MFSYFFSIIVQELTINQSTWITYSLAPPPTLPTQKASTKKSDASNNAGMSPFVDVVINPFGCVRRAPRPKQTEKLSTQFAVDNTKRNAMYHKMIGFLLRGIVVEPMNMESFSVEERFDCIVDFSMSKMFSYLVWNLMRRRWFF